MDIKFHCDENTNFKRNQSIRAFSYADYSIEPHNHDFYEMNIVLKGEGLHQIEDSVFSVKRGDVFVIPPMVVHAYYNTEHLEVYHILFKKNFIRQNATESSSVPGFLQLTEIEPFLRKNCAESMFLHLNTVQLAELERDIQFISDGGMFGSDEFSALKSHTAWKVLYYLSALYYKQNSSVKSTRTKYEKQIMDTIEYMHLHLSDKLTTDALAAHIFVSRSTLLRNFQILCGCSPTEYLMQIRVKKALELLEGSSMTKTEIAHFCGFYDQSHMNRSIKKADKA